MKKPFNFVLIGKSGSGKGTQAQFLMERFGNLHYFCTGDMFRTLAEADTVVGAKIREILAKGKLPLDDIATTLWMHDISFNLKEGEGILADGFPRRLPEAKNFDRFLEFLDKKETIFYILIDVSRKEAFDRMTKRRQCKECNRIIPWMGKFKNLEKCDKCGGKLVSRPDDTEEAINNRLDYYEENVVKVVGYYKELGRLIKVMANNLLKKCLRIF